MKAYKTNKLQKYKYFDWTQPVFTADTMNVDGIWYNLTASSTYSGQSYQKYRAFDGDITSKNYGWWTGNVTVSEEKPAWLCLQSDHKLKLTSVSVMNGVYTPDNFKTGFVQVSNDGVSWTNVATLTGTNTAGYVTTVDISVTEGYHYYRLYFTSDFADGVEIQEVTYTGQIAKEVETNDYDYSVVQNAYKMARGGNNGYLAFK